MSKIFLLILLLTSSLCQENNSTNESVTDDFPFEDDNSLDQYFLPNVIHLDDSNFTEVLKKYDQAYVLIYAAWCSHCHKLMPIYNETANYFKENKINVTFFKIDGGKSENASVDFGVMAFPRIFFINKGKRYQFEAQRTKEGLIYFRERKLIEDVNIIQKLDELKNIKNIYDTNLILLSTIKNKTSKIYKSFLDMAEKVMFMDFASCLSEECLQKYGEDIILFKTFDEKEKVLFSADSFGKFGAIDYDDPEGWACEARRYYFGIVGKFGNAVQELLKKAGSLDIQKICALHGPLLPMKGAADGEGAGASKDEHGFESISYYLKKYNIWSSYGVESDGVAIFYTSVYGHTKLLAEKLAEILIEKGCPKVVLNDLAREDIYECVEDAFRYGKIVLATTTYNGGVFPKMKEFIDHLTERNYQNRKIGFIENGSWAPSAVKGMVSMLEGGKDISFCQTKVSVKITPTEANLQELRFLADELC